ncbi:hypothetical protein L873DRAFT_77372 [Choiromyces venosus 120613-1]|uniref:Uncharacterized protein n=1 Tax=Choiromyces venosus 120613-1 TaxID=1336337 RepID=A0A3N4J4M7_9PEZI|nr:hypothetical protein L873DRAFT_77372 [Choiromyces venosus 120613-1]
MGKINVLQVRMEDNLVNVCTKGLPSILFDRFLVEICNMCTCSGNCILVMLMFSFLCISLVLAYID